MTNNNWTIDPAHSQIQFKVRHLAVSNITGTFTIFRGQAQTTTAEKPEDIFNNANIRFSLDTASIDTNNTQRDTHLKGEEFFNAEQYPQLTFNGTLNNNLLTGDLTIRGITKPITLEATFNGTGKGRFGDDRAGFEVTGKIDRKDFGLTWNLLTETGLVIGDEIRLQADIQLILQPAN